MNQTFLMIISLLAAGFSFFTRQPKKGLGFLIYTVAFFLSIPSLAFGIKSDFLGAAGLVLFVFGGLVIVWKKPEKKAEPAEEEK